MDGANIVDDTSARFSITINQLIRRAARWAEKNEPQEAEFWTVMYKKHPPPAWLVDYCLTLWGA